MTPFYNRRRASAMLLVVLLIMGAIILVANVLIKRTKEESRGNLSAAMRDPQICLERFFAERWQEQSPGRDEWQRLTDFMSRDDLNWMESNRERLAMLAQKRFGGSLSPDEDRQRFAALRVLLGFGHQAERPLVSSIRIAEARAIAYVHPPGRIDKLSEVALINEGGLWKIRRFLGQRDSQEVMDHLVGQKQMQSEPLSTTEQRYLTDPAAWRASHRQQLLSEVGLTP